MTSTPDRTSAWPWPPGVIERSSSVFTPSGHTACTPMPSRRTSEASADTTDSAPAFDAAYTDSPGTGPRPDSDTVTPISPPRVVPASACSRNAVTAARAPQIGPSRLTSTSARARSSAMSVTVPSNPTPALLTQAPSGASSRARATAAADAAGSVTSQAVPAAAPIRTAVARAAASSRSVTSTR